MKNEGKRNMLITWINKKTRATKIMIVNNEEIVIENDLLVNTTESVVDNLISHAQNACDKIKRGRVFCFVTDDSKDQLFMQFWPNL